MALGIPTQSVNNSVNSVVVAASGSGVIEYVTIVNNSSAQRWYWLINDLGAVPSTTIAAFLPRATLLGTSSTTTAIIPFNSADYDFTFDNGCVIVVTSDHDGTIATSSDSNITYWKQTKS